MKKQRLLTLLAVTVITFTAVLVNAELLVYEPFDYPDAPLNGNGGALGTFGTWTTNDTGEPKGWWCHPEGELTGQFDDRGPGLNMFDGILENLPTTGGFVGSAGPTDQTTPGTFGTRDPTGNMDANIGLDPSVTATFQSGTTTWFSYVGGHADNRNQGSPTFMICTDPTVNGSRGLTMQNSGNGIGGVGGPPRFNLFDVYPHYFQGGVHHQIPGGYQDGVFGTHDGIVTAFVSTSTGNGVLDESGQPRTHTMAWQVSDDNGFGAANIIVGKIEWDADTNGEDIITVVRFLETDEITEAAFDALVADLPALSSANWPSNKPSLDQSQFDTINISSLKFYVDEIRIATTFEEVIGGSSDRAPSNGAKVGMGDLLLSWVNLPPVAPETKVYTKVYLGTEPNELAPGYDMAPVITEPASGEDVNSVTVNLAVPGTYYWYVEMYTMGDGIGEPNILETWNIIASDKRPDITNLTPDMMTWSGEPVPVSCDIEDDGYSPLSIAWSTDLPEGITAEFIPDAVSEQTSVKLNKVPYFLPYISNGSFEVPALADKAAANTNGVASWSTQWSTAGSGTWANDNSPNGGAWDPNDLGDFSGVIPDGENVGYVNTDAGYEHGLYQQISKTVEASAVYGLSVKVGNPSKYNGGTTNDYRIELLVNGSVVASTSDVSPVDDQSWITAEVSYTGADPNVGQPIAIRLVSTAAEAKRLCFDDVQLTINGEAGEYVDPAAVVPVRVTVEVSDAENTSSKSLTIDVYDDACQMAILGEEMDYPGDLDTNCIVEINDLALMAEAWLNSADLMDFADMAAAWLVDYSSQGPVPK